MKPEAKEVRALVSNDPESTTASEERTDRGGKEKPIIRAIRVTSEVLAAAKEYKKAKGVSFYALGQEAISERLMKEGFLKKGNQ